MSCEFSETGDERRHKSMRHLTLTRPYRGTLTSQRKHLMRRSQAESDLSRSNLRPSLAQIEDRQAHWRYDFLEDQIERCAGMPESQAPFTQSDGLVITAIDGRLG